VLALEYAKTGNSFLTGKQGAESKNARKGIKTFKRNITNLLLLAYRVRIKKCP